MKYEDKQPSFNDEIKKAGDKKIMTWSLQLSQILPENKKHWSKNHPFLTSREFLEGQRGENTTGTSIHNSRSALAKPHSWWWTEKVFSTQCIIRTNLTIYFLRSGMEFRDLTPLGNALPAFIPKCSTLIISVVLPCQQLWEWGWGRKMTVMRRA